MESMWILGGSGDVGRAVGARFGAEGWDVFLSARTPARLDAAVRELESAGVEAEGIRLDAADRERLDDGVDALAARTDELTALVYNVGPQAADGEEEFSSFLEHTALGLQRALRGLESRGMLPDHVVVTTSSKARDPSRVSVEYHAAKQAAFAVARAFAATTELTATVLWLGRRGTEDDWRWLHPEEMAEKAWESYLTRPEELLVGDLY